MSHFVYILKDKLREDRKECVLCVYKSVKELLIIPSSGVLAKAEIIILSESFQRYLLMQDSTKSFNTSLSDDSVTGNLYLLKTVLHRTNRVYTPKK
jgi:hypothetical protein